MDMAFKNRPQGLPLKFHAAYFGAIKHFMVEFFIGSLAGSGPEITIMVNAGCVFRPNSTKSNWNLCYASLGTKVPEKSSSFEYKKAQLLRNICVQMETHPKSAKNLWIKILEHMTANLRNKVSVLNQFGVSV